MGCPVPAPVGASQAFAPVTPLGASAAASDPAPGMLRGVRVSFGRGARMGPALCSGRGGWAAGWRSVSIGCSMRMVRTTGGNPGKSHRRVLRRRGHCPGGQPPGLRRRATAPGAGGSCARSGCPGPLLPNPQQRRSPGRPGRPTVPPCRRWGRPGVVWRQSHAAAPAAAPLRRSIPSPGGAPPGRCRLRAGPLPRRRCRPRTGCPRRRLRRNRIQGRPGQITTTGRMRPVSA